MFLPKGKKNIFTGDAARNGVPVVLALVSVALAALMLRMGLSNRETLPSYLFGPCIVAGVCCCLCVATSIAAFVAIRTGEGYHRANDTKHPGSLRSKHHIRSWGLKYIIIATGGAAVISSFSYLYMTFWTIYDPNSDYCANLSVFPETKKEGSAETDGCTDSRPWFVIYAGIIIVAGLLNYAMERVIDGVESRFTDKRLNHRANYVKGGAPPVYTNAQRSRASPSMYGDDKDPPSDEWTEDEYEKPLRRR